MPELGRVLEFRPRTAGMATSRADAVAIATAYLAQPKDDRRLGDVASMYGDPDVLMAICGLLRDRVNVDASEVLAESTNIFAWVSARPDGIGYFDERDFFLGESSLLAGCATRLIGDRADADLWLDRADANFRHTINPTPNLARVSYTRLTLRYDMDRHKEVLELVPSVALTFEKLGIFSELVKCSLLEAMSLKSLGLSDQAAARFESLLQRPEFASEVGVRAIAMLNLGNLRAEEGRLDRALVSYREAMPLLEASNSLFALADLKAMVGDTLRSLGQLGAAVASYRAAVQDYVGLGMKTRVAYVRVILAEALLAFGNAREAEWEVLAALPTLDEQKMVPEGFAAVAVLRESARRRKTDARALGELREYLQARA